MDLVAPWIALAASLASLAASIRLLIWIADRPPVLRRRTVIGVCAEPALSPPANRNEPSHAPASAAGL